MTEVVQFSGGKDSTALLYLMRPQLDRVTVLFGDTGAVYPHVRAFVEETCRRLGARLEIVRPEMPVGAYTEQFGLPADIVPVEALAEMAPYLKEKPKQLLRPYLACCKAMIFDPMQAAIREMGATTVYRGSRKADARVGVPDGFVEDGITYLSPLWHWSDADVMAYLKREGVTLPAHYESVPDSLDCWLCTGHLARHGAAKMQWTRENYADLWPELSDRLRRVEAVLEDHVGRIAAALDEGRK
jgi:phosphoadenosine phosphosulfate reductase